MFIKPSQFEVNSLPRIVASGDVTRLKKLTIRLGDLSHTYSCTSKLFKYSHEILLIHLAVINGQVDMVRTLVRDYGVDINQADSLGNTALIFAALTGRISMLQVLVRDCGVDLKQTDSLGETAGSVALGQAAGGGCIDMVRALVRDYGVDINQAGSLGKTPLHYAAMTGPIEMVRVLVEEFGADINQADFWGMTAIHYAVMAGLVDRVPSGAAAEYGRDDKVRLLIGLGADPEARKNIKGVEGMFSSTPLELAISNNDQKVVHVIETAITVSKLCEEVERAFSLMKSSGEAAVQLKKEELFSVLWSRAEAVLSCCMNPRSRPSFIEKLASRLLESSVTKIGMFDDILMRENPFIMLGRVCAINEIPNEISNEIMSYFEGTDALVPYKKLMFSGVELEVERSRHQSDPDQGRPKKRTIDHVEDPSTQGALKKMKKEHSIRSDMQSKMSEI